MGLSGWRSFSSRVSPSLARPIFFMYATPSLALPQEIMPVVAPRPGGEVSVIGEK